MARSARAASRWAAGALAALVGLALALPARACLPGDWQRHDGPVYRDPMLLGLYEAASDGHVFFTEDGRRAMVYSGDDGGQSSIKLAFGTDWDMWEEWGPLLGPSRQPDAIAHKETAFYLRLGPDDHRIYFIGYADEDSYEAEIYLATAPALTGPWRIEDRPVIPRGTIAGRPVSLITSPSVVRHEGRLVMTWLGWNGFRDVTEVWSFTATSQDGTAWSDITETPVPIGMEGQLTARPDGGFVAVATQETEDGSEGIFAACADDPMGPWTALPDPLLVRADDAWEVDEIIAPSIVYDPATGAPYLYYTAAEHSRGWRMMLATPAR